MEVDTVCCENIWVSARHVIVSYDLQNKLGKYILCLEGTVESVGPKGTNGLVFLSGPRLFHILINDLDRNFDASFPKCIDDLKVGCG